MSKLLIDDSPLQVLPKLAIRVGLNEAIFLQQLHFLTKDKRVGTDGHQWLRKTYPQWRKDTFPFWSVSTIERAAKAVAKLGLVIIEQRDKSNRNRDNFYAIDREFFAKWEQSGDGLDPAKLTVSEGVNLADSEPAKMTDSYKDQILIQDQELDHTTRAREGKTKPRQAGSFDERNDKSPKRGIEEMQLPPDEWVASTKAKLREKLPALIAIYDEIQEQWWLSRFRDGGIGKHRRHTATLLEYEADFQIFCSIWNKHHTNGNGFGNGAKPDPPRQRTQYEIMKERGEIV